MLSLYVVQIEEPYIRGNNTDVYHTVVAANNEEEAQDLVLKANNVARKNWIISVIKLPDPNTLKKSGILDAYC